MLFKITYTIVVFILIVLLNFMIIVAISYLFDTNVYSLILVAIPNILLITFSGWQIAMRYKKQKQTEKDLKSQIKILMMH